MASIVSKLARAAFATRASPTAVVAIPGGGRPAAAIRVSPAGRPKSEEEEKAKPKSEDAHAALIPHPKNPFKHLAANGYLDVDEKTLESDDAMWAFYGYWCKYHGISRDRREMARRFRTFKATARRVHKFNSSSVHGKASMNGFADMTQKEIFPGREYIRAMRAKK